MDNDIGILKMEFKKYIEDYDRVNIGIRAATNHNPLYAKIGVSAENRKIIRSAWLKNLAEISDTYKNKPEKDKAKALDRYKKDVVLLQRKMNSSFFDYFMRNERDKNECGFTIAHAQKSLSVFMKYLWCSDPEYPEPPACPIDSHVLCRLGWPNCLDHWTSMNNSVYSQKLDLLYERSIQENKSIAELELRWFYETVNRRKNEKK